MLYEVITDLRAATPSAAAELAVMSYQVIFDRLLHSKSMLQREMTLRINIEKKRYESLALKLSYNSPKSKIRESRVFLMNTSDKLRRITSYNVCYTKLLRCRRGWRCCPQICYKVCNCSICLMPNCRNDWCLCIKNGLCNHGFIKCP